MLFAVPVQPVELLLHFLLSSKPNMSETHSDNYSCTVTSRLSVIGCTLKAQNEWPCSFLWLNLVHGAQF